MLSAYPTSTERLPSGIPTTNLTVCRFLRLPRYSPDKIPEALKHYTAILRAVDSGLSTDIPVALRELNSSQDIRLWRIAVITLKHHVQQRHPLTNEDISNTSYVWTAWPCRMKWNKKAIGPVRYVNSMVMRFRRKTLQYFLSNWGLCVTVREWIGTNLCANLVCLWLM